MSYFQSNTPRYPHKYKSIKYVPYHNHKSLRPNVKRVNMLNVLSKWKTNAYGFNSNEYEEPYTNSVKNCNIYNELLDGIWCILMKHNKEIYDIEQMEEDILYYLYSIMK